MNSVFFLFTIFLFFWESQIRKIRSSFPLDAVHWDVYLSKIFPGFSRNAVELRERIPMSGSNPVVLWGSLSSHRVKIKDIGEAAGLS